MGNVSGLIGTAGGFGGTGVSGPSEANILSPTTGGQADAAYGQTQQGLKQQEDFLRALQLQNGLGNQSNVYNQLSAVAQGNGPNPAQQMLANATGANVANQAALAAGQRGAGANVGLIARQAGMQGANMQQNAAGQAANMQANQSANAINQMGGLATSQIGQQANALNSYNQQAQNQQANILNAIGQQNNANVTSKGNVNSANAALIGGIQQGQNQMLGNMAKGASQGATAGAAAGGAVQSPEPLHTQDVSPMPPQARAAQSSGPDMASMAKLAMMAASGGKVPHTYHLDDLHPGLHAMYCGGQMMAEGGALGIAATPTIDSTVAAAAPAAATTGPQSGFGRFIKAATAPDDPKMPQLEGTAALGNALGEGLGALGRSIYDSFKSDPIAAQSTQTMTGGPMDDSTRSEGPMRAAKGGKVPVLVSPGEKYLDRKDIKEVKKGADPMKVGKEIPGKPVVGGAKNSYANDTVPAKLEEGGIVIPRSVTQSKDAEKKAIAFVKAVMARQSLKKGK